MKTIQIFSFEELSNDIQKRVIDSERETIASFQIDLLYQDYLASAKTFSQLSNCKNSRNSYLYFESCLNFDLKGLRLARWIINNWGGFLYKRKYISSRKYEKENFCGDKQPFYKELKKIENIFFVSYYSRIFFVKNDYNLTGAYSDYGFLNPIYQFLAQPCKHTTLQDILNDISYSVQKEIENQIEYFFSNDFIKDELMQLEYEFTEMGVKI
jgi:hypothetical protein